MQRDDILIVGSPAPPLRQAFHAVSHMHRQFDRHPAAAKGSSRTSCILCSDIAAEAFAAMGFSARPVPTALLRITAAPDGRPIIHKAGSVDGRDAPELGHGWNGHMVVLVDHYLFDPTFWQIDQTASLPAMIALPARRLRVLNDRFDALARLRDVVGGVPSDIAWVDTPENTAHERYRGSNRAVRKRLEIIRRDIVRSLVSPAGSAKYSLASRGF